MRAENGVPSGRRAGSNLSFFAAATNFSTNASNTGCSTITRCADMHCCPLASKPAAAILAAASSRLASASTRLAALEPSFALRNRRVLVVPPSVAGNVSGRLEELALGTLPSPAEAPASRLQGCLPSIGGAGVTLVTLQNAFVESRKAERAQAPWRIVLSRILGLQPNTRWECLAVQLETAQSPVDQHALLQSWRSVTNQLQRP